MTRVKMIGLSSLLVLLAGACGDAADEEPVVLEEPVEQPVVAEPAAAPMPGTASGAVLAVDTLEGAGPYLTDASGRALYLLEGEPQGESTCYDACAEEWPPFLAPQGSPTAGAASVQPGLIGTLQRRDGSTQVTYGGHALYYYHDDQGPGQTAGHDLTDRWGEWYLVQPGGEALEEHAGGTGGA